MGWSRPPGRWLAAPPDGSPPRPIPRPTSAARRAILGDPWLGGEPDPGRRLTPLSPLGNGAASPPASPARSRLRCARRGRRGPPRLRAPSRRRAGDDGPVARASPPGTQRATTTDVPSSDAGLRSPRSRDSATSMIDEAPIQIVAYPIVPLGSIGPHPSVAPAARSGNALAPAGSPTRRCGITVWKRSEARLTWAGAGRRQDRAGLPPVRRRPRFPSETALRLAPMTSEVLPGPPAAASARPRRSVVVDAGCRVALGSARSRERWRDRPVAQSAPQAVRQSAPQSSIAW